MTGEGDNKHRREKLTFALGDFFGWVMLVYCRLDILSWCYCIRVTFVIADFTGDSAVILNLLFGGCQFSMRNFHV